MKSCVKCGNCETDTLEIDHFWSKVGYDGRIWKHKEVKIFCKNCFLEESSHRINETNNNLYILGNALNDQTNNLKNETNKKSEELQALIQSLSLRIDESQAVYDSKTEEFEQTIEDKFEQLDETISDFTAGAQRFNQAKLESLLAEKEAVLNLEISKKDNEILKQKEEIADLKLKLNQLELKETQTEINHRMSKLESLVEVFTKITTSNQLEIDHLSAENSNLKTLLEARLKDEKQYELIEEAPHFSQS